MLVVLLCSVLVVFTGLVYASKESAKAHWKEICNKQPDNCDNHTNWKPFYHGDNVTVSYEYDDETGANGQQGVKLHISKNSDGYIYFYVKKEKGGDRRWPKEPAGGFETDEDEALFRQLLTTSSYMIFIDKIDCKREVLSEEKAYRPFSYDAFGDFILTPETSHLAKNIKLDGHGQYGKLPFLAACESFSQVWKEEQKRKEDFARQQMKQEAAIAEKEAIEKLKLEKEREEQKAEAKRKSDEHIKQLKQYGVQYIVNPINVEVDPFKFKGKIIACKLHFERMMSATTASFTSGYSDTANITHVVDQIIVSGIPRDTHFAVDVWGGLFYELILRGKGTTTGTNAFGAKVSIPHFQYIGIIKSKK